MLHKFCAACLGFHPVCAVEAVDGVQGREFVGHVELIDMLTFLRAYANVRGGLLSTTSLPETCR